MIFFNQGKPSFYIIALIAMQCNRNADISYSTRCSENNLLNQEAIAFQTSVNAPLMNETVVHYQ